MGRLGALLVRAPDEHGVGLRVGIVTPPTEEADIIPSQLRTSAIKLLSDDAESVCERAPSCLHEHIIVPQVANTTAVGRPLDVRLTTIA